MRRLGHWILIGVVIVAVLAAAGIVGVGIVRFTVGSKKLAAQLSAIANERLVDAQNTRVRIADVGGNPFTHLVLHGVQVEVRRGGAWVPFLSAGKIETGQRLDELTRARPRLRLVRVVEPRIVIARGGPLPRLRARAGGLRAGEPRPGGGFGFTVDRFLIERATVQFDTIRARVDLVGRLEAGDGGATIAIDSLAVRAGRQPEVTVAGKATVRGDVIELEALQVASARTRVVIDGALEGTRAARLRVALDPLDLADAQSVAGSTLLGREGWVRGTVELDGAWRDLEIALVLAAQIGDDRVEDLRAQGRVSGGAIEIQSVALDLNGVPFRGSGRVGLGVRRGESHGRLEFESVDLRDFPVLRDQPWMPEGTLSGILVIGAEGRGTAGRERPFDLTVRQGVVRGFVIAPGHFRGAVATSGRIRLAEYAVTTRGAAIAGAGEIDPRGEMALEQELAISDLVALGGMLGERRFGGRGRLRLQLAGPVRSPTFTASGMFDSLVVSAAQLRAAEVKVERGTFRPFGFGFEVTSAGGTLSSLPIDGLAVAGSYLDGRMAVEYFAAGRGETELHAAGQIDFSPGGMILDVSALEASVGKERWESAAPVRIGRRGSVWTIEGLDLTGPIGALSLSGSFEPGGQATALEAHLVDVDLASLGALLGREGIAGKVKLSLLASGGGDTARLEFHATADSLRLRRFSADHVEAIGSVHGETITISRFLLDRGGRIEVAGDVRFPRSLGGFAALERLARRATWREAVVDLGVRAPALDLTAWHGLHPQLDRVAGTVDLTAAFTGRPGAPEGTITLGAEKLRVGVEELSMVDAQGRLSGGLLALDSLRLTVAGSPVGVRGTTPVRVSLIGAPLLDPELPIALHVDLTGSDIAVARLVTDRIVDAAGPLSGAIEIGGTRKAPLYRGAVNVNGARLRIRGREEMLTALSGRVEFAGDRMSFANIEARDRDKGTLKANGTVTFREGRVAGYDVTVELRRFEVGVTGEYAAILDGAFRLQRNPAGGLPEFTGSVLVHRLDYLREVGRGEEEEVGPSSWVGRFDVELPGNAWIRNADLEVELRGQVTYERRVSGRTILGRLETVRGTYTLFGHTFRITSGEILFTDPDDIDPELSVSAETRVPEARIFANISGRASDRQVVLTSDPDYDQATLWKMLVPSGAGEVTSLVAMTPFVSELERTIFQEIPGLSVSIEERVEETGESPTLGLRAGTYVGSEIFFSAYQGFASGAGQDVSVEYDLGKLFILKGSAVRRGITEGSQDLDEEYNLDLNLRWEF